MPVVTVACDLWDGANTAVDFMSDPLGFIATKMGEAAAWFLEQIVKLMEASTTVDFTNPGFLKQYALIFAVSSILTVVLWLIAVAKRAAAGTSLPTAMGEAVGLLLAQVVVSAFTPAVLLYATRAVDEITKVFAGTAIKEGQEFIEKMTKVIGSTQPMNLPVVMIIVFLLLIVAAILVWIELLIRAGALYVGAAVGPLVAASLVDRDLWPRCKKWAGMLLALLLAKPVLFALFGLAAAIMNSEKSDAADAVNTLLVGALLLFLAVFSSASIYKWLPVFGDQMGDLMNTRKGAAQSGPLAAVPGPAQAASSAMNARMMHSPVVAGKGAAAAGKGAASAGGGAAAAAGPVAAGAMAVKAGADAVKNKAHSADTIADQGAGDGESSTSTSAGSPSTAPSDPGGSSVVPTGSGASEGEAPSSAEEGASTPAAPSAGGTAPAGPSVVPNPGAGDLAESSPADSSTSPSTPTGPSVVPAPDTAGTTAESSPADSSGSPSTPAGPSVVPSGGPAGSPPDSGSGEGPGAAGTPAPAAPSSSRPAGSTARAVPSTVPSTPPSAPGTPSRPTIQGSDQ
ncbi:hypothetical protein ACFVIM_18665 [Streptomyces sp. NPDC057638]|uniref:hypothetical protein n=1 Tax=Streptomyces sp. NPDC057638 TaxID=3346190 RepID=UPI0036A0868E